MVLAEFYRADAPERVVGTSVWDRGSVAIDAEEPAVRRALERVFRPTPVVSNDSALRSAGTSGPVVLQPGGLIWFRAVAGTRGPEEGLAPRILPQPAPRMGWDPAGAYRTFTQQMEWRLGGRRPDASA